VLYQAGSSARGRMFAGCHAECVFINGGSKKAIAATVADLRAQAAPRALRIFMGATLIVGRTETESQALFADYRAYASQEGALVHAAASLGIDFAAYHPDEPVDTTPTDSIRSNIDVMTRELGPGWTTGMLAARCVLGSRQPPIVGDPSRVADILQDWVKLADIDGFNLSRTVAPECWQQIVDLLVPELQARGCYKRAYAPGTLRQKLFGTGPRLMAPHPAVIDSNGE
jgi:alkanesulfonate monooxygenase SsuD/methylene tetrahydromethanopterin reductase-like flavin-dependent oxidoreductase (luciferase family)